MNEDENSCGPVVVRIAPSPTGDPHVGTAYIALFNRALRMQRGGRFILRIEDTDRRRSNPESEAMIYDALGWLGLEHDEGPDVGGEFGPYRQSERASVYAEHTERLIEAGRAYRCFCTEERIRALREEQKREGRSFLGYDGRCRDLAPGLVAEKLAGGEAGVVRLKAPREGETVVRDLARGDIAFRNDILDDQVLLKSDGLPTYHLANVVDDHLMGMTHVIRAEEWISSTPKHVLLYEAFGWEAPVFIHMPILRNKDQSKISKRRNPVSLVWYRDGGFLPEALVNFLATMGYSIPSEKAPSPDNPEIFSFGDLVKALDLGRIKTSGPVFDLEKLDSFNGHYVRALPHGELADRILEFLGYLGRNRARLEAAEADPPVGKGDMAEREERRRAWTRAALPFTDSLPARERVLASVPLVRERLHGLLDWADRAAFLFEEGELDFDPALLVDKKKTSAETAEALKAWAKTAGSLEQWDLPSLEEGSRAVVEAVGWKVKPLFMALRVAVTGRKVSPPLFESMEVIGRERTLERIHSAAHRLEALGA